MHSTCTSHTSHTHHMHITHITCTSHAHHTHITCTSHASHAHHMHITHTSHAHHTHITDTLNAPHDAHNCSSIDPLLLCHLDVLRSTSVISRLNKSCVESIDTLTPSNPTLSAGMAGTASPALEREEHGGLSSPSAVTLGSLTSAKPGEDLSGYLGLFSLQGRGVLVSTLHAHSVGCTFLFAASVKVG